ncbi:hypothetical protein [Kitasatospora sp. NPDC087314]
MSWDAGRRRFGTAEAATGETGREKGWGVGAKAGEFDHFTA